MTLQDHIGTYRVKYALKATLAAIICVIINAFWHLQFGFFSVITAYVLISMFHDHTLEKGLQRFVGIFIGAVVALLIIYLFTELKPIYLIGMAAWVLFCMYLFADNRFPFSFAALMSGLFSALIMLNGTESLDQAVSLAIHLIKQVALGVIVATLIDRFLLPLRTERHLHEALSAVFADFGNLLSGLIKNIEPSSSKYPSSTLSLDTFNHLLDLIMRTAQEQKDSGFPEDLYIKLVAHCKNVFLKIEFLEQTLHKGQVFLLEEDIASTIKEIFDRLAGYFQSLGQAMKQKKPVKSIEKELHQAIASLETRYLTMRNKKEMSEWDYTDVLTFGALLPVFKGMITELDKITTVYNAIQRGKAYDKLVQRKVTRTPEVEEEKEKEGFQIDKDSLKHSIKVLLVTMLILFGTLYFNLPGSVQALITAIIISAQANLGQASLKERLRFIAVVVGGLYGLVVLLVVSQIPHFLVFLSLLSLGLFVGSYITTGSERVAYAGLQIGIVLPLILLISNGPPAGSMSIATERFIGVVVGGAIALLVLRFVWPVDPLRQLKEKISTALTQSGALFATLVRLEDKEEKEVKALIVTLASAVPTSTALLKDVQYVIRGKDLHAEEFLEVIDSLEGVYVEFETLDRAIYGDSNNILIKMFLSYMTSYSQKISACFNSLALQLMSEKSTTYEIDIPLLMQQFDDQLTEFRQTGVTLKYGVEDFERFSVVVSSVLSILSSLNKISAAINQINGVTFIARPLEAA